MFINSAPIWSTKICKYSKWVRRGTFKKLNSDDFAGIMPLNSLIFLFSSYMYSLCNHSTGKIFCMKIIFSQSVSLTQYVVLCACLPILLSVPISFLGDALTTATAAIFSDISTIASRILMVLNVKLVFCLLTSYDLTSS